MIIYLLLVVESLALQRIRAYQTSVMDLYFLLSVSFSLLLARYLLPGHLAIVSFNVSNAPSCLDLGWDAVTNVHNSIGEVATKCHRWLVFSKDFASVDSLVRIVD